ncbi:MAG TPA: TonB family protein [Gemmatimonadaceae bacterium]|nr:TonB family protein [Gemmatimonadaceae bacterium]
MRTMHLIESGHTGHTTTGLHSFFSITLHVALVLAALWATTRTAVERGEVPDPRVYFVPEARPVSPAPVARQAPAQRAEPSKPAAQAQQKIAAPAAEPSVIPATQVPLADPSAAVAAEPAATNGDPAAPAEAGSGVRSGPYEVGEVEVPAAPLSKAGPEYPEWAIRNAVSGTVTARFIVDANGRVESDITILDSTSPEFTSAVRNFLRRARYRAARVGGRPVRQLVEQRFVFALQS